MVEEERGSELLLNKDQKEVPPEPYAPASILTGGKLAQIKGPDMGYLLRDQNGVSWFWAWF